MDSSSSRQLAQLIGGLLAILSLYTIAVYAAGSPITEGLFGTALVACAFLPRWLPGTLLRVTLAVAGLAILATTVFVATA